MSIEDRLAARDALILAMLRELALVSPPTVPAHAARAFFIGSFTNIVAVFYLKQFNALLERERAEKEAEDSGSLNEKTETEGDDWRKRVADEFHKHRDGCLHCRHFPLDLCPDGSRLLRSAASALNKELGGRQDLGMP